jgi:hypothetical protein
MRIASLTVERTHQWNSRSSEEGNRAGNEANTAFGRAWPAVNDVSQAAADRPDLPEEARSLLDEMASSQTQLPDLVSAGAFAAVCGLALSIVVPADRLSMIDRVS